MEETANNYRDEKKSENSGAIRLIMAANFTWFYVDY